MVDVYAINWNIGSHVSFEEQTVFLTVQNAINQGMYTTQFFMGNPQSCKRCRISEEDIINTQNFIKKFPMNIFSHFPYIANFAGKASSKNGLVWNGNTEVDKYISHIISELEYELLILSKFGKGVVIHPGSYSDRSKGHDAVIKSINKINFPENSMLLLENCAGEGNKLCKNLKEIKYIIDNIEDPKRKNIGVCIDTAHLWGEGDYDLSIVTEITRFFEDFKNIIGLEYFKLLHLNDSEVPLGSKKDRHACLGKGQIWNSSFESLVYLLNTCKKYHIPMVLETNSSDMITLAKLSED